MYFGLCIMYDMTDIRVLELGRYSSIMYLRRPTKRYIHLHVGKFYYALRYLQGCVQSETDTHAHVDM